MLVGRVVEWAEIDRALRSARGSEGRVVLLRGEAGLGKTALLERAAAEPGFTVLRATGVEAEATLPYATAHQLFYPLLPLLDRLPPAQADAIRVALGTASGSTPDRFLVALGFLSLVSEAAAEAPLLLLLDDAQWWDTASMDAVLFLTRRIATEPVAMLLAQRLEPDARDDPLAPLATLPGLADVRLDGLPAADVVALLGAVSGVTPPAAVGQQLASGTHGNALALVELARVLTDDQLAGRDPLPQTYAFGDRLERPFRNRAAALSGDARQLLLVSAAEPGASFDVLAEAAGVTEPQAVIEEIESSGLARHDGRSLLFCHPLARAAVYADAGTRDRHLVHVRLADALWERGEEDRSVWHRAAATLGVDDEVADALDRVAERAEHRSGHAAAAAARERAAELSGSTPARVERLVAAGESAWLAGQPARARLLVDQAERLTEDPVARGRLRHQRARAASRNGDVDDAHRLFLEGAALLREERPAEALLLLAEAAEAAAYVGDASRLAEIAELATGLDPGTTPRERFLAAWLAATDVGLRGRIGDDALVAELALVDELGDPRLTVWAGIAALNLGDLGGMQLRYRRALEQARAAGAAGSLPYVLEHTAMSLAFAGSYAACRSAAEEGLRLARETEQQRSAGQLLAILAFVAATRGDERSCLAHAEEARSIAGPRGIGLTNAMTEWALARLDLGLARHDQAVDRLASLASARPGVGHPVVALWSTPDLVEAAARARRTDEVAEAVARMTALAEIGHEPGATASAAWCRGMLGGDAAAGELEAAAIALEELGFPVASGRARLALGELLRRERRPRDARPHLRTALATFHEIGAEVWAERASAELRADGDASQPVESNGIETLTPQELQIVRSVSRGLSNKEIAAQLFISPRTVEYHLYKAYPKLGISSRTQLISRFPAQPAGAPVGA